MAHFLPEYRNDIRRMVLSAEVPCITTSLIAARNVKVRVSAPAQHRFLRELQMDPRLRERRKCIHYRFV